MTEKNSYRQHAEREFAAAGWDESDEMQQALCEHLLKLLDVFAEEGHSGTSATYTVEVFRKLALFKPIAPLTGQPDEWLLVGEQNGQQLYQNTRCSHVFKEGNDAYDIDGRIFYEWRSDEDGAQFKSCFTNRDSRVSVTFPYTPNSVYEEVKP